MRYTHAVVVRIGAHVKFEDKKSASKTDVELAKKQQEDLNDTLREAGIEVIELAPEDGAPLQSLHVDDYAIVINGTALICRPKKPSTRVAEIQSILASLAWDVAEAPQQEHGKPVVLEGSDVLYTGREIFVGIRKNGTNTEGALVVARTFSDLSVVPIPIHGNLPLKQHISLAAADVLTIGKGKDSQAILHRLERDATFRYRVLTLGSEEAVSCFNVNDRLIFRHDLNESFRLLQPPTELWGVTVGELVKLGSPLSKFCLLVPKVKVGKI